MSGFAETKIKSVSNYPADFSWSPEESRAFFERIEREAQAAEEDIRRQAHAQAWDLAKQQGVQPIRSIEDLQGDFWPEDESVDEFLEWVRAIRQQDRQEPRSE
ncbi:MAG: hypothetical protein H0T63_00900 [Pyrinomonadaceae bacterium]|jgi:hypothetical protein|nr:hypothetical protein [Pyrinomonadaceae bacterium]